MSESIQANWFKREISVGNLLTLFTLLCSALLFWHRMDVRVTVLETQSVQNEKLVEKLVTAMQSMAESQARLAGVVDRKTP